MLDAVEGVWQSQGVYLQWRTVGWIVLGFFADDVKKVTCKQEGGLSSSARS